jgi:hypothetical protein
MKILKKMSRLGIALLILNEIRGILVVVALLSGGAQAIAHQGPAPSAAPAPSRVASGL